MNLPQESTLSESEAIHRVRNTNDLKVLVEKYCVYRHLNRSQVDAITSAVIGLMKSDGVRTKLLQGPPGKSEVLTR